MKLAPAVAVAAPVIGAAGAGAIAGAGELAGTLGAPTVARTSVGTGVLDAAGNEIMKDVTTYGPNLLRQHGSKALMPMLRYALRGAGLGAGYKILDRQESMNASPKAKDSTAGNAPVTQSAPSAPADNLPAIKNFLATAAQVPASSPVWNTVSRYLENPSMLNVLANGGDEALSEELSGRHLMAPAALLAGVVTLHNPLLLAQAVNFLKSSAVVPHCRSSSAQHDAGRLRHVCLSQQDGYIAEQNFRHVCQHVEILQQYGRTLRKKQRHAVHGCNHCRGRHSGRNILRSE